MDQQDVEKAVGELQMLVEADGAKLILEEVDPNAPRIDLRLDLAEVSCLECVLPPELLHSMIDSSLHKRLAGEFEVIVADPRLQTAN